MNLAEKFKQFTAGDMKTTQPIITGNTVLLVDGLNLFIRAFSATPTMDENGEHIGGITGFLLSLGAVLRTFKPSRCIIVWDGPGGSQRRRSMFSDYKSGRKEMSSLNRTYNFKTLEEEKKAREHQKIVLHDILSTLPITFINQANVEADDVIAFLAQTATMRNLKTTILSTDKDFLQLVNENVSVYSPIKKVLYTPEKVVEDYGFHPNNFLLYRTVTGDNSDNIPGVAGIKEKTLLKYFPELANPEVKDIDHIIESATRQAAAVKKPAVALQTLIAARTQLNNNIALMRLDEVAMSGHTKSDVLDKYNNAPNAYNKLELTKLLQYHKLMRVFNNYEAWLQSTFVPLLRYKIDK